MAANNQGITHLRIGGKTGPFATIACKNYRAHIAVDLEKFRTEAAQCARCANWLRKWDERKALKASAT